MAIDAYDGRERSIVGLPAFRGERRTLLVLRDLFLDCHRFDELQASLRVATNVLSQRPATLTEEGIVERRPYCDHPERFELMLTQKGRDLQPVLLALLAWGDRYTAEKGPPLQTVHGDRAFHAVPVCSECGEAVDTHNIHSRPGPGADGDQKRRQPLWLGR